ncbi:MAG: DivIVA domain-containing protein [Lachnospiraceae bacterium]|nr:DivIVA domain-containing protein [Ruminococcus sp.]MCM1275975.1 DivIVA domain-containing protein [Lachnospiraceae bacterium]
MAGEGGFKVVFQGFDKNEVNEYISNLRKTMKELETEKRTNDEKTAAAVKIAEAAEERIKAAEQRSADRIAELELQVKTERRNAENLTIQIDELKRKLKHPSSSASGKVDTSAAQKQSADIIAKANETARDIVEKAKKTAQEVISGAQSAANASGGQNNADTEAFMSVLKSCLDSITGSCGELGRKASELLGKSAAPVTVTMPDFSSISAPQAEVPAGAPEPAASAPGMSLSGDLFGSMDDGGDDDMMSAFGDEDKAAAAKAPEAETLGGFDMSAVSEPVDKVAPNDTDNMGRPEFNNDFMKDLIAQTVPSSALGDDVDDDLRSAVKEEEEKFSVKPSDEDGGLDFNMDMGGSSADADDPMAALLAQAQAAFGGGGGGFDMSASEPEQEPEPAGGMGMGSSGDWADLQKQLEAMEQSGGFGGSEPESAADEAPKSIADDPKAPSADDSAIWNFGDMGSGSSDDDDMSSDLFGSF